jgi:hypothetical protein
LNLLFITHHDNFQGSSRSLFSLLEGLRAYPFNPYVIVPAESAFTGALTIVFILAFCSLAAWIILHDEKPTTLNNTETANILNNWLQTNFYRRFREWQYKDIKPKILLEKYIDGENELGLLDYKFFCFDGVPALIQVNIDRFHDFCLVFMDMDWNETPMALHHYPRAVIKIPKPRMLKEMCQIASTLANNFRFCRVDLYNPGDKVIFGELTFTPNAGFEKITPPSYDFFLGSMLGIQ